MLRESYAVVLSSLLAACATSAAGTAATGATSAKAPPASAVGEAWPAGQSPREIGKRVAENYARHGFPTEPVHYKEACTWYGALAFAKLTGDEDLDARLVRRFDPLLVPSGAGLVPARDHVDDRVFGIVPLEIALHGGDGRALTMGKQLADIQWARTTPDGISAEARYWVDDMWMITALQAQAFRATGQAAYLDRLQQPNGLFFHTERSPKYWGRGNGWFAAGMAELLRTLPANHPQRARILAGYTRMMAALLQHQTASGLWRQLIDHPEDASWIESSSSAMFAYAMITGVKNGWLPEQPYGQAARRAWLGLVAYLDADANLREVCVGTGEAFTVVGSDPNAQVQYYLARQRNVGDFHGQAPVLWSASALLR
jgi:unsaturated rhamnogalacturonyl hydrolase